MPHIHVQGVHPTAHAGVRALAHAGVEVKLAIVRQALPMHLRAPSLQPPRAVPDRTDGPVVELQQQAVVRERDDVHVAARRLWAALVVGVVRGRLQRGVDVAVERR